jgi:hypothetical protein
MSKSIDNESSETVIEICLKLNIRHSKSALDENSVKALINHGMDAMADNAPETLITINNASIESILVEVVSLKEDGKKQNLDEYGTDDVPLGRE